MKNLTAVKKILSFMTCAAVSVGATAFSPSLFNKNNDVSAKTITEVQEQRRLNEVKIAELETQIQALEGNKKSEKEYQNSLYEQIVLIQDNINLLNSELESIANEIDSATLNIQQLDILIAAQQEQIDANIEIFKQRLAKMYMSSNDNIATILLGSMSFYDMMSRVQMMNRMSEYDEQLINNIVEEIEEIEKSKSDLEAERINLQLKLEDQENKMAEKNSEIEDLNEKMAKTTEEINRIALEQKKLELSQSELSAENIALAAEEDKITAAILEAQKKYDEEQKRIAEEAQKKAEEEAAIAAQKEAAAKAAAAAAKAAEEARIAAEKAAQEAADKAAKEEAAKKAKEEAEKAAAAAAAAQAAKEKEEAEKAAAAAAEAERLAAEAAAQAAQQQAQQAQINTVPSATGFIWPVPGFSYISSYYGPRSIDNHKGIDVGDGNIMGGAIVASRSGYVITADNYCTHNYGKSGSCGCGGGYGNYVVINHDSSYTTLYGHMTNTVVTVGQYVEKGQIIGYVGSTGWSTGAHLHFEVKVNGVNDDPMNYVSP